MVQLDSLIFIEHIVNSLNLPIIFVQLMSILFPVQSKVVLGNNVLSFIYYTLYFIVPTYRAIGGLGIAGVRVLCISFHNVVICIGAKRLVDYTGLGLLILSVVSGFGVSIESFLSDPQWMICFTLGYQMVGSSIDAYMKEATIFKIFATTYFIFNLLEFICHVILFVEVRKQHKIHVQLCLQNKTKLAKLKKRRNTISAVGHFTSWFAEILIFGLVHYIIRASGKAAELGEFYLRLFMPSINFVIFPAIQALTSNDLRRHVFSLDFLRELCKNIYCKFKMGSNDVQVGDAHDIELQALGNNAGSNHGSYLFVCLLENHTVSIILPRELSAT